MAVVFTLHRRKAMTVINCSAEALRISAIKAYALSSFFYDAYNYILCVLSVECVCAVETEGSNR